MEPIQETLGMAFTRLDDYIKERIATASPNRKYALEIAIRLPMLLIIHQWLLLAPYSDYTILEIVFCIFRMLGGILMLGTLEMGMNLVSLYSSLTLDILVVWKMDMAYRFMLKAIQECESDSCPNPIETEDILWSFGNAILIKSCYLIYIKLRHDRANKVNVIHVIWNVVFSFICWKLELVTLFYFINRTMFCVTVLGHAFYYSSRGILFNEAVRLRQIGRVHELFPRGWILRDMCTSFAILYYFTCFMIDIVRLGSNEVLKTEYFKTFIGSWTSSGMVLVGLAGVLVTCSNLAVAISGSVFIGHLNFRDAFEANIGYLVGQNMLLLSLQAGVLFCPLVERTDNLYVVILVVIFSIVCQLWDMAEARILFLMNIGERAMSFAVFRVLTFMAFLVIGPTYILYHIGLFSGLDIWPLLNTTGVVIILARCPITFVECGLLSMSYSIDDGVERLSDLIYFTRMCKSFVNVICLILLSYYRFISSYLNGPIIFKLSMTLLGCVFLTSITVLNEWKSYQRRHQLKREMNAFADATSVELDTYDNVCAVCCENLHNGKRLMCGHIFHMKCLARWFQVKTTCPYCNTDVHINDNVIR